MTSYQPTIPTGTLPLNQDYINLRNNFQQLDTTYGTDHVAYSTASNNGYHTSIHLVPQTAITNTAGFGQIFDKTVNDNYATDQILYYNSGTGNITTQMTRNFLPVSGTGPGDPGHTFLPGGIVMIWGSFNPTAPGPVTVTFPFGGFRGNVVNIQLTGSASNNSTFRNNISTGTLTKTGFTWEGTIDSHFTPIYYLAIGY